MIRVIIIFILIAGISFFVAKYFWVNYNDVTKTTIECDDNICPAPEGNDGSD